MVKYNMMKGL